MREESDRLCREYGLSVIEMPQKKTPRKIHEREKNGEPTKYSLMRRTMLSTMKVSTSWEDFCHRMHDSGYDFDPNFGGKYAMVVKSATYVPKYVPSRFCHDFGAEKAKIAPCQSEREK